MYLFVYKTLLGSLLQEPSHTLIKWKEHIPWLIWTQITLHANQSQLTGGAGVGLAHSRDIVIDSLFRVFSVTD